MKNSIFTTIQATKLSRNLFDLGHEKKLSMNMGDLVPIFLEHGIPGDSFRVNSEILMRLAPMLAPVMHRCDATVHYYFVPYRLLWDSFEDFITGGDDGMQAPVFPKITINSSTQDRFKKGMLSDYLGIPDTPSALVTAPISISALPFRAYTLIYQEYYRDQNLQAKPYLKKTSTVDQTELAEITTLRKRAWEKDYLCSALPFAQKGGDVTLPNEITYKSPSLVKDLGGNVVTGNAAMVMQEGAVATGTLGSGVPRIIDNLENVGITIADLRRSARLQEWLEKLARGGSRYTETILNFFGIQTKDHRLQRPEYIGGGKAPVTISEVLSTFNNETVDGGTMYGHGLSVGTMNKFDYKVTEHGLFLGLLSVLPKTSYQDGLDKHWTKFDRYSYYWPQFANIGEQTVLNHEVYMDYTNANPNVPLNTWAYQPRYSEYKFAKSSVHGDMKDNLDYWHMGRKFTSLPALNGSFITSDPTHRIFPVTDVNVHKLYVQLYNDVKALRPMPIYGTPML